MVNQKAIDLLVEELDTICKAQEDDFNYHINVDFNKYDKKLITKKDIFFTIQIGDGVIRNGSTEIRMRINCITNHDNIDKCREVLNQFTNTYNLVRVNRQDHFIVQAYSTPRDTQVFNRIQNDYSAIMYVDCDIVMSNSLSFITDLTYFDGETDTPMDILDFQFNYSTSVDVRSKPQDNGINAFTESIVQNSTIALTIQTFLDTNNPLIDYCVKVAHNDSVSQNEVKTLKYKIGGTQYEVNVKVVNFSIAQQPETLPICVISFIK